MDFLDPQKQKAHKVRLIIGYVLIGLVVILATIILLYQAFGFGIDRHGKVIQNGLVFVSSVPSGAEVYINGKLQSNTTNSEFVIPAGQYVFEVKRPGYRDWKRAVTVEGGRLQRFQYPFLFPTKLETTTFKKYTLAPGFVSQSPNLRWTFVQAGTDLFELFDLKQTAPEAQPFRIPIETLSAGTATTSWQEVAWSKDNQHCLVRRIFTQNGQTRSEYILLDREDAAKAQNLTTILGFSPTLLQFRGDAYDSYYAFDQTSNIVFTASLKQPTPQPYVTGVLAFASEGSDLTLYATQQNASAGKVRIVLQQGATAYTIRQVTADAAPFLLDTSSFDGTLYIAVGASKEGRVYVYRDPLGQLEANNAVVAPSQVLKVAEANVVSFSPTGRNVMAQNTAYFADYDVKTNRSYTYQLPVPVETAAVWMDDFHLMARSSGVATVFDYDGTNRQALVASMTGHLPFFSSNYQTLYSLLDDGTYTTTPMLTAADR